jgi:hypothetical protein
MNALPLKPGSKRKTRLLGALLGAGLVALGLVVWSQLWGPTTAHPAATPAAATPPPATTPTQVVAAGVPTVVDEAGLELTDGVRLLYVAVSADGGLVDMRYQVVDADKAAKLHSGAALTEIVDERSGVVVNNLFMGHTHSGTPHDGQTEFLLFENPGNMVQTGGKVTVVLGTVRLPHVPVE